MRLQVIKKKVDFICIMEIFPKYMNVLSFQNNIHLCFKTGGMIIAYSHSVHCVPGAVLRTLHR